MSQSRGNEMRVSGRIRMVCPIVLMSLLRLGNGINWDMDMRLMDESYQLILKKSIDLGPRWRHR